MDSLLYILVGASIGVLSATFGIGGAFILTPILNAMGMPIVLAIGTSLTFTVGVSLTAGFGHFRQGNCSLKTTALVGLFTLIGVTVSFEIVERLAVLGSAERYVGMVYIVMLIATSLFVYRKSDSCATDSYDPCIKAAPYCMMEGDKRVSLWNFMAVGLFVGFLKGFLGVGGGFILVPLLIWVVGMTPHAAVGTSLSILFVSSIYASGIYAFDGKVDYFAAAVLAGSAYLGSRYGLRAVNKCDSRKLTRNFSLLLLLSSLGIIAKQLGFVKAGMYYSIVVTAVFAVYVLYAFRKTDTPVCDFEAPSKT
ncbi:MAG: sulfite exporter TauE/SafE family protein [Negativicutes bacterium]|nr:sulfite exporter TauE/SafE family protein [Negativicutes bacterium]